MAIVFLPSTESVGTFEARTTTFLLRVFPTPDRAAGSEQHDAEILYLRREGVPLACGTRPNRQLAEGVAILRALEIAERDLRKLTLPRMPCGNCGRPEATEAELSNVPDDVNAPEARVLCWARAGLKLPAILERANRACEGHVRKLREGQA